METRLVERQKLRLPRGRQHFAGAERRSRPLEVALGARATQMQRLDAEFLLPLLDKYPLVRWEITGIAEKRLRESTLLQVVPKEQTRLPSSACLSQSFSYHADLLEDDGDGLRTPPGARGGAGQLI